MGIILDGKSMNSPLCRQLMAKYQDTMAREDGVDALLTLEVEQAFLDFDDEMHKYRPYLLLLGRPVSIEGQFPFGVSTIRYDDTVDRTLIMYRYDFNRQNLTELAQKGLFDEGFEVPDIIRQNEFVLPCRVNCVGLDAERADLPPVVFASIEPSSLRCTDATSDYNISEYFESVPESAEELEADAPERPNVYQRTLEDTAKVYENAVPELKPEPMDVVPEESRRAPEKEIGEAPVEPSVQRDASGVAVPTPETGDAEDEYI